MKRFLCFIISCICTLQGITQSVTQCRYWINDNFSQATTLAVNSETVNLNMNYSSLANGYYQVNFQFKQSDGRWSSPATQWFFKRGSSGNTTAAYRYWLNDDYANAVTVNSPIDSLDLHLPLSNVPIGYYQANFQFQDKSGNWSSLVSSWVYKTNSNNQLVKACRYWFDNDVENAKTIVMQSSTYDPVITKMDVEGLSLGTHSIHIQFQDDGGAWSSVVSSFINRNEITDKILIEPKLYVQKSVLNPGDIQVISGNDFTSGGQINLLVQNSRGDIIASNTSFNYSSSGSFSYQMPITSSMPGGEYSVSATDATTGVTTPVIKFRVNNNTFQNLWVSEPSLKGNYSVNSPIGVNWNAFVSATDAIGKTGLVPKKYKVEFSKDNGGTWQFLETLYSTKAQSNQTNSFKTNYIFATAGNYIIKITDLDDLSNFNTTSFTVRGFITTGFTSSLEWDHSIPRRRDKPVGVAADGTARIFIKLNRDAGNTKFVKQVTAQIFPVKPGDNSSGIALLGRVLYATEANDYSLEGNSADRTNTSMEFVSSSANDFSFWYVAPDDFTQELKNQDAERLVKVTFNITYTDNTSITEEITIRIARPPLMLVHGLGGDHTTWDNFQYNVDGTTRYFKNAGGSDGLFKNGDMALDLKNYESFKNNADILLGVGDQSLTYIRQSFRWFIRQMNLLGFAANRVDYVGHSMGGSIARMILSPEYVDYFRPGQNNTMLYKNYGRGFINKLITLNSPHNGSKWADLITSGFPLLSYPVQDALGSILYMTPLGKGGFRKISTYPLFKTSYEISPAVKNLRSVSGGVVFGDAAVKNHLIGSGWSTLSYVDNSVVGKAVLNTVNILLPKGSEYEYFNNTDGVVSTPSQFASINILQVSNIDNSPLSEFYATIGYRKELLSHMSFKDELTVGTRVMRLLNSKISSGYFADQIAANSSSSGRYTRMTENESDVIDSIKSYVDKNYIEIIEPDPSLSLQVDSTVNFKVLIKDTAHLQNVQIIFQGELYQSDSKVVNQTFNVKIHSNSIGYNQLVANALYDSLGYSVYHTDTATFLIKSLDTLKGFYVMPHSRYYNRNEVFEPVYNVVYNNYVGVLNEHVEGITFSIADTNVVTYIDSLRQFTTKDTGTTYVLYHYKGFTDTGFVYVTLPHEYPDLTFSGKAFLQGAYNTSTNSMNNTLNTSGLLTTYALSQPYNTNTFKYESIEHVTHDFFTIHPDIVDWVLVELRDSATPSKVIATRAALIRQDGTIVETNGSIEGVTFSNILPGNYYVVIRHRNHLAIRSSSPIDFTSGSGSYDFTTAADKSYQNQTYTSTVQIGSIWAMRAGNANSNNSVKYNGPGNDQNQILNIKLSGSLGNILNNVYAPEDINMNGNIKWNGPGNDQNFLLNTILNGSLSTIYLEQL